MNKLSKARKPAFAKKAATAKSKAPQRDQVRLRKYERQQRRIRIANTGKLIRYLRPHGYALSHNADTLRDEISTTGCDSKAVPGSDALVASFLFGELTELQVLERCVEGIGDERAEQLEAAIRKARKVFLAEQKVYWAMGRTGAEVRRVYLACYGVELPLKDVGRRLDVGVSSQRVGQYIATAEYWPPALQVPGVPFRVHEEARIRNEAREESERLSKEDLAAMVRQYPTTAEIRRALKPASTPAPEAPASNDTHEIVIRVVAVRKPSDGWSVDADVTFDGESTQPQDDWAEEALAAASRHLTLRLQRVGTPMELPPGAGHDAEHRVPDVASCASSSETNQNIQDCGNSSYGAAIPRDLDPRYEEREGESNAHDKGPHPKPGALNAPADPLSCLAS